MTLLHLERQCRELLLLIEEERAQSHTFYNKPAAQTQAEAAWYHFLSYVSDTYSETDLIKICSSDTPIRRVLMRSYGLSRSEQVLIEDHSLWLMDQLNNARLGRATHNKPFHLPSK